MFIGYLRVSTDRQQASGLGLDAQRLAIEQYAVQRGVVINEVFVETESGALRDRPQLAVALAACRRQKATLLIAKLDRLARNVAFVSALMETGIEFVAVDAPYANRLLIHILSAFAQHEREQISERTKAALAAAKARGVKLGRHGTVLAAENRDTANRFAEVVRPPHRRSTCFREKISAVSRQLFERSSYSDGGERFLASNYSEPIAKALEPLQSIAKYRISALSWW